MVNGFNNNERSLNIDMADLNTVKQDATNNAWIERNSLYQAVSDVLEWHWDPMGQSDSELRQNSYDGCVSMVYNAALKSDCKEQLIKYLNTLARDEFGIHTNEHNDKRAGQIIFAVRDFYFTNVVLMGEKDSTSLEIKYLKASNP